MLKIFQGLLITVWVTGAGLGWGGVPSLLHHQGRVLVHGQVYEGEAWFKFAFVNVDGSETYWGNAPDQSPADGQPDEAVSLTLARGLYSVLLGDTTLPHMAAVPETVFQHSEVYLRVWFSPDGGTFQQLGPDQRVAAVGYALMAATVEDGAITAAKLAPDVLADVNSRLDSLAQEVANLRAEVAALSASGGSAVLSGLTAVSPDPADARLLGAGFALFTSVAAPPWRDVTSVNAPSPRTGETAVWTGTEMLVWGGEVSAGRAVNNGAGYRPQSEAWQPMSPLGAPTARSRHTAVWTGTEMLVWGGFASGRFLSAGARFSPDTRQWRPFASSLAGRMGHVAVWTGRVMLIWGGRNGTGLLNDGDLFNPTTGLWEGLSLPDPPAPRQGATAVWTGDRVLVWGGEGVWGPLGDGAALRCDATGAPRAWEALDATGAPVPRAGHTAVWTGSRMIVWGGRNAFGVPLNDGATYDPATGQWEAVPAAPGARSDHAAVWTGREMLVVGGRDAAGPAASGYAYDPVAGSWRTLSGEGHPLPRQNPAAVWTGTEIIVEGGVNAEGQPVGTAQRLTPEPTWYFYRKL